MSAVRIIVCEIGEGIIGVPVETGPRLMLKEDGKDVIVDTLLIRDVVWDDGRIEVVALVVGKGCRRKIDQMVKMTKEKMAIPGCTMVRISRVEEGWRVAGWIAGWQVVNAGDIQEGPS